MSLVKNKTLINFGSLVAVGLFCFGCSSIEPAKNTASATANQNSIKDVASKNEKTETAPASPCENRYYPIRDGKTKRYKNSIGTDDTLIGQEYKPGEAAFNEVLTIDDLTVKQIWRCTDEGLIAPNYGSGLDSPGMKLEPKHVSGVTLPKDSELAVGKTWTVVYKVTGDSQLGKVDGDVTVVNKVLSLDDQVTVPGGTFKAMKVAADLDVKMTMGKSKFPIPTIKTEVWFAPNVGLIKSAPLQMGGALNNKMEYAGDK